VRRPKPWAWSGERRFRPIGAATADRAFACQVALIQLAIHFDGLLVRFGRVVPDALAMLEGVLNIGRRLRQGSHPARLELSVIRFASLASSADAKMSEGLLESAVRAGVDSYFQPLSERARVISSAADLSKALRRDEQRDMRIVLLSASAQRVKEAAVSGIEAFHVWESGPLGERWLPYRDVPRRLEEMLRIPTARPMAPSVRHGALVARDVAGEADARLRGLEAIRRDPNADWVTLAGVFILYTEDPDLEDHLVGKGGFQRLSFDVKKGDLVIDTIGTVITGDTLFSKSGISLRKRVAEDSTRGPAAVVPWNKARQRILPPRERDPSRRTTLPSPSNILAKLEPMSRALQPALRAGGADTALSVYAALVAQLPADSAVDLTVDAGKSAALLWHAPYGSEQLEDLAVVVHDVSCLATGSTADSPDCLFELALSVVLERTFTSMNAALGSLHCLRVDPAVSVDNILEKALLATERTRIAVILELSHLSVLRQASARLKVTSSNELEAELADLRRRFPSVISSIVSHEAGTPATIQVAGVTAESTDTQAFESLLSIFASLLA
jgi:hypothetical protein